MIFARLLLCCLLLLAWKPGQTQQITPASAASGSEPQQANSAGPRTLSGSIADSDGALVPGAKVTLTTARSSQGSNTITDADGHFSFSDVAAGPYTLKVTANGLQGRSISGSLNPDESLELPPIQLQVAPSSVSVEVTPQTQHEIAAQQLKQEEKQRLVGVIPNFYVTYDWNAAPLSTGQKYSLAARSLYDPATFVIVGGFAGIEQAFNVFSGFGQGAAGYGKRYGAGLANVSINTMLGGAVFPELFHQDPRYFYKGTGTVLSRIDYALKTAFIQRGDNGEWQPAYSGLTADFATAAISNLYYPASDRAGVGLTIGNGFINIAGDAAGNLLQEFVLKKLTRGIKSPQPSP